MYDQKLSFFRRSKASRRIYGFFPDFSPFFVALKTVGKLGGQNWKFKNGGCKFSEDFSFLMSLEVNHQNSKCKQSFSQICIFVQCHLVWKLLKQSHFTTFCPKSSFFCLWDFLNKFQTLWHSVWKSLKKSHFTNFAHFFYLSRKRVLNKVCAQ